MDEDADIVGNEPPVSSYTPAGQENGTNKKNDLGTTSRTSSGIVLLEVNDEIRSIVAKMSTCLYSVVRILTCIQTLYMLLLILKIRVYYDNRTILIY